MLSINISGIVVLFVKLFAVSDRENVLATIPVETRRVVFIDTPATTEMVNTITALTERGVEVVVRDHHDEPAPSNPRAQAIADAAGRVRALVPNAIISDRATNPGCSSLIRIGEFVSEPRPTVIVADPDLDGLLGAMKATGVVYPGMDEDAAILDGPRSEQRGMTPLAETLTKAMASLPPFDLANPGPAEKAKAALWGEFVAAASGNEQAKVSLETKVAAYEEGLAVAKAVAATAVEMLPGMWFVDTCRFGRFDLTTAADSMNRRPGCLVTVMRKPIGPIATKCGGIQYSLSVPPARQKEMDLRTLVPEGQAIGLEVGLLANTSFLLHCSQEVWDGVIFPALAARFGA